MVERFAGELENPEIPDRCANPEGIDRIEGTEGGNQIAGKRRKRRRMKKPLGRVAAKRGCNDYVGCPNAIWTQ